jgi:hypothetical protein
MATRTEPIPTEQLEELRKTRSAGMEVISALNIKFDLSVDILLRIMGIDRHPEGVKRTIKVDTDRGEVVINDEPQIIVP